MDRTLTHAEVEDLIRFPERLANTIVRNRRFPQLAPSIRMGDLSLSARTEKCLRSLKRRHGFANLSDLSRFTIGELLLLKNFGRKSLVNLLSSVLPVIIDHAASPASVSNADRPQISAAVTAAAERLRAQTYSGRIYCNDPRFRSEIGTLLLISNSGSEDPALSTSASLHAVAHRLTGRIRENSPPERTLGVIRKIRYKIARARQLSLERELEDITQALATGRNVNIVLSLFGWSGSATKTLQVTGTEFHMTRERVRQITSKFREKIQRAHPFTPTLKRTIGFISERLPATAEDIETELQRIGLTQAQFRIEGVVSAAEVFDISVPFIIEGHPGIRTVVRHEDTGLAVSIVRMARRCASHVGLSKVADLCDRVGEEGRTPIEGAVVKRVLQSLTSLHWLDDQSEWFRFDDVRRNHLVTLVTKVLSVAPRIHVSELRAAIANDPRGLGFAPPKSVVLEFCITACNCRIEGDHVIANRPPSVAEALSKLEQIAYSVLAKEGPILHRSDFERKCIERGMNRHTFLNYIGRIPILARYAPGVYGLRGAPVVPGDVERCIPSPARRLRDCGWNVKCNAMAGGGTLSSSGILRNCCCSIWNPALHYREIPTSNSGWLRSRNPRRFGPRCLGSSPAFQQARWRTR